MTEDKLKKLQEDLAVVNALFQMAVGEHYIFEEVAVMDENGAVQIVTLKKQVPPSVEAQLFWLCNRQPELWKMDDAFDDIQSSSGDLVTNQCH